MGPILFLYYEESLVSSNLNSKLFWFHSAHPKTIDNKIGEVVWIPEHPRNFRVQKRGQKEKWTFYYYEHPKPNEEYP